MKALQAYRIVAKALRVIANFHPGWNPACAA
jgi:hypothetical protein